MFETTRTKLLLLVVAIPATLVVLTLFAYSALAQGAGTGDQPRNLRIESTENGMLLTWAAPAEDPAESVTGYRIMRRNPRQRYANLGSSEFWLQIPAALTPRTLIPPLRTACAMYIAYMRCEARWFPQNRTSPKEGTEVPLPLRPRLLRQPHRHQPQPQPQPLLPLPALPLHLPRLIHLLLLPRTRPQLPPPLVPRLPVRPREQLHPEPNQEI